MIRRPGPRRRGRVEYLTRKLRLLPTIAWRSPDERKLERLLADGWEVVHTVPPRFLGTHTTITFRRTR